jgi:hypothetical protein
MTRFRMFATISLGALLTLAFAGLAQAAPAGPSAENGTAALVHVGSNPSTCANPGGTVSGVVNTHTNIVQDSREINISVHGALSDTTYVVDIRCEVADIGTLTTNAQGTGTAHIDLIGSTWPTPASWTHLPPDIYYIDLSIPRGGGGAGGYGDTFIAGPFSS